MPCDMRHTGHCRTGWTRCPARWPPPTRCRETSTSTSPSPAPGSPACGPPTTWPAPSPALRIAVCEAKIAGFGASGRNGGWCSALFPASLAKLTGWRAGTRPSPCTGRCSDTVDEVGRVAAAEGIDCHWAKGGTVHFARSPTQLERARAEIAEARAVRVRRGRPAAADRRRGTRARRGDRRARRDVHAALRGHPPRPAGAGLAEAVRRRGVAVHEATPVTEIAPGSLRTPMGTVRARYVIRATEGYTPRLPGLRAGRSRRCTR